MMKKRNELKAVVLLVVLLTIAVAAMLLSGCSKPESERTETPPPAFESVMIENKAELQGEWFVGGNDRKLILALSPEYYTSANTEVEVSSSDSAVVAVDSVDKFKLRAVGEGSATITVSAGGKTDSVDVTVNALETPTIGFADQTLEQVDVYPEEQVSLPDIEALSCDGIDLQDYVTVTANSDKITLYPDSNTFTVAEPGDYELTFIVKDSRDETKTASVVLKVKAYRNLIKNSLTNKGSLDAFDVNGYEDDLQQTVTATNNDNGLAGQFDLEPSKAHYAEITFKQKGTAPGYFLIGVSYSDAAAQKWFVQKLFVDNNYGVQDLRVAYHDTNGDYDLASTAEPHQLYSLTGIVNKRGIPASSDSDTICKVTAVRIDDIFYMYVNGVLVDMNVNAISAVDSVPGLFFKGVNDNIYATEISYCSGDEARAKFAELPKTLKCATPQDTGSQFNPCSVFEGDFEFECTYQVTAYAMNDAGDDFRYQNHRWQAYVKDVQSGQDLFNFGAYFTGYQSNRENAYLYSRNYKTVAFDRDSETKLPKNDFTFRLERIGNLFTVTVQENTNGGVSYTDTFELDAGTVSIRIDNYGIAGEYTNVVWNDEPQVQAYYLNMEQFGVMSKNDVMPIVWAVREDADVVVESDNESVVAVEKIDDDIVLKAIGAGVANITVTADGEVKRSVAIEVYEPLLQNPITNMGKTDSFTYEIVESEQVITADNSDNGLAAQFAGVEASDHYYAEITFKIKSGETLSGAILVGATHSNAEATKWIVEKVLVNTSNAFTDLRVAYHDTSEGYDLTSTSEPPQLYSFNISTRCPQVPVSSLADGVKVAIYRNGDLFYFYINDVLVDMHSFEQLAGVDTVPGIFIKGVGGCQVYATEISVVSGDAAQEPDMTMTIDAKNNTGKWFNMPFDFEGDFECSFTYQLTDTGNYGNNRLVAEIKAGSTKIGPEVMDSAPMGIYFNGNSPDATYGHKMFAGTELKEFSVKENGSFSYEPMYAFVFTISRSGNTVTYSIAEKGGTVSVSGIATVDESVTDPLRINVKSCGTVGIFSDFVWSTTSSTLDGSVE